MMRNKIFGIIMFVFAVNLAMAQLQTTQPVIEKTIAVAPTNLNSTIIRSGAGRFGSPRAGGKTHTGVDLVATMSSMDKKTYEVKSCGKGIVAYARMNGDLKKGFGYTIIIDHGNGLYTFYAHLAVNASKNLVKLGDAVKAGQIIGYMADLKNGEASSGNVHAKVVKPHHKIQTHFELFYAPKGRSSVGQIKPIKKDAVQLDPTTALLKLKYREEAE